MNRSHDQMDSDEDVKELFRASVVEQKPVDLNQLFTHARHVDVERRVGSGRRARNLLMTSGVCVCLLATLLVWNEISAPRVAFGQVKEKVKAAQSVRYIQTTTSDGVDSDTLGARSHVKESRETIEYLKNKESTATHDERAEIAKERAQFEKSLVQLEKRLEERGDQPWKRRVMILGRYLKREEVESPLGDYFGISNAETGRMISVLPDIKKVVVLKSQITIDLKSGASTETAIEGNAAANLYQHMKDVPDDAKPLAETKRVDGVELVGFQTVETIRSDTWTREYWIDPVTKLPRRIEVRYRSTNPMVAPSDWVLSEIEFNVEMDEELFSSEVPEGYAVEEGVVQGYWVE